MAAMTAKERADRAKELVDLIGEFVEITLRDSTIREADDHAILVTNVTTGYIIDVSPFYMFLGESLDGYCEVIEIDNVSRLRIVDDIVDEFPHVTNDGGYAH